MVLSQVDTQGNQEKNHGKGPGRGQPSEYSETHEYQSNAQDGLSAVAQNGE